MKWSRELAFLKRRALPLQPASKHHGLSFVPLDLDSLPLGPQLDALDVLLHKATDEVVNVSEGPELRGEVASRRVEFSIGFRQLRREVEEHNRQLCVVDPLELVLPLLDRAQIQALLQGLPAATADCRCVVRPPASVEVESLGDPGVLKQHLENGRVALPVIVKPLIACGAALSHTMAIVFRPEGFQRLPVPTPATIQEYVSHGEWQYKCYVLGDAPLFIVPRRSTPRAPAALLSSPGFPAAITFDSLKSLPAAFLEPALPSSSLAMGIADSQPSAPVQPQAHQHQPGRAPSSSPLAAATSAPEGGFDREALEVGAAFLRQHLRLTLFGFDVVVDEQSGAHVVVDLNYFPSFSDVPNAQALPALWKAIRRSHHKFLEKRDLSHT
eukprot:TRINITY_DN17173_c0_g1_i2.p1 TRINITY_DN17173_c0_g1~~TRINITY_DN17173_c0_g1_i2.p1  ORF type:complete len:384 (+),score=65.71 TRINITY_DN17173_c0_g1_i2:131-1282(+)